MVQTLFRRKAWADANPDTLGTQGTDYFVADVQAGVPVTYPTDDGTLWVPQVLGVKAAPAGPTSPVTATVGAGTVFDGTQAFSSPDVFGGSNETGLFVAAIMKPNLAANRYIFARTNPHSYWRIETTGQGRTLFIQDPSGFDGGLTTTQSAVDTTASIFSINGDGVSALIQRYTAKIGANSWSSSGSRTFSTTSMSLAYPFGIFALNSDGSGERFVGELYRLFIARGTTLEATSLTARDALVQSNGTPVADPMTLRNVVGGTCLIDIYGNAARLQSGANGGTLTLTPIGTMVDA